MSKKNSRPLFRRRDPSLLDLLPWDQLVAEGVMANVDGGLFATYAYRGPDLDGATSEEIEALLGAFAQALKPLGDGWMVQLSAWRLPAPGYPGEGAFPDPFTRAVDEERRRGFERAGAHFGMEFFLTLTWKPSGDEKSGGLDGEERALEAFEAQVGEVVGILGRELSLRRLSSRELVEHCYGALTFRHQRLALPAYPVSLEAVFGSGDLVAGKEVAFGETAVVPVAVVGFPETTSPGYLDFLSSLTFPFHAVWRWLPLDPWSARKALTARRTRWVNAGLGVRELLGMVFASGEEKGPRFKNRYAPAMAQDVDDALYELEAGEEGAGYLTFTLLFFDEERAVARGRAEGVIQELRNRGFVAWEETWNAPSAYLGALPGCGGYNVRRPLFLGRSFLDLAPTTAVWAGEPRHPHPELSEHGAHVVASTSGATPFYLSLSHGDVQHALVVGPTGAGKSVLLNLLLCQYLRYPRSQVFAIDKGRSLWATALAARGQGYAFTPGEDSLRLAPLAHLEAAADRRRAADWLEDLVQVSGVELGPELRERLGRALQLLAAGSNRTLTNFRAKLQDPLLRQALEPYTASGAYGFLFDGEASPLRHGPLHVFEMESVLPLKRQAVTPLVLHLFAEIERRLDGRPTVILVEEALSYVGDTLWAGKLTSWLYELRKKNAGVVFVAQTLGAILESRLRQAVLESCPTRIYLPNPAAREEATAASYRAFGLSERQIEVLARATPKKDYYAVTPSGSRLFELDLSPGALAVFRLAGPGGARRLEELRRRCGEGWLEALLEEDGGGELASIYRALARES